ncbi:hypothetical protein TraAM80_06871 [Trypanosoma rangeli]|uniref:EF-hand domain-containing protein n=1 Tax=Trypanosoma rangeli TaxID=5698 RepID=A0A3R7M928_TRYRA|nr:uncharacterized protein TraAM80_06871 [Trypanosoma rangeli]RNF01638.1 hypothetical protein TraAM80_06871 [Trypanosoma rangeli]|eukprot:RNF01638.1 hypothetical protein TraAM80_06871 [Trypanosoma rangeli]
MTKTKKETKNGDAEVQCTTVGARQLLVSVQDKLRRQKHAKFFDELLVATEETTRGSQTLTTLVMSEVPVLAVGYIARAMGLNLSNKEVLCLLEMVEETDAASRGVVSAKALKEVIVEALMTGVMAPPRAALPATTSRKKRATASPASRIMPISVVRDSEEAIYHAFSVLDLARRGYLEAEEMRRFLRSGGEPFTEEEVEQFLAAAADPESGRIYYEEFADVLATE